MCRCAHDLHVIFSEKHLRLQVPFDAGIHANGNQVLQPDGTWVMNGMSTSSRHFRQSTPAPPTRIPPLRSKSNPWSTPAPPPHAPPSRSQFSRFRLRPGIQSTPAPPPRTPLRSQSIRSGLRPSSHSTPAPPLHAPPPSCTGAVPRQSSELIFNLRGLVTVFVSWKNESGCSRAGMVC